MAATASRSKPLSHYRPPSQRQLPPLPPKWEPRRAAARRPPPMGEFVLLSILLHALAILLFGAPEGGSREGRALWGSLDVVIARPVPPPLPLMEPLPPVPPQRSLVPPAVVAAAPPAPAPAAPVPPVEAPYAFPPLLDRIASPERLVEMSPVPQVPPPTETQAIAPPPAPAPAPTPPEPVPESTPAVAEMPAMPAPLPLLAPHAAPAMLEPPTVEALAPPAPLLESLPLLKPQGAMPTMAESPTLEVPPEPAPGVAAPTTPTPVEAARVDAVSTPPARESSPFRTPAPSARDDASAYDPTAPSLDAEALRRRAGELARQGVGNRALIAFPMPPVPAKKSKLEAAIENARKPDCKTAYQGLGLAAIVPLIANEFGEGTCRW